VLPWLSCLSAPLLNSIHIITAHFEVTRHSVSNRLVFIFLADINSMRMYLIR